MLWDIRTTSWPLCFDPHYLSSVDPSRQEGAWYFIASNIYTSALYFIIKFVYMGTCVHVCRSEDHFGCSYSRLPPSFCWDRDSLAWFSPRSPLRCLNMTIFVPRLCLSSLPHFWDYKNMTLHQTLLWGSGDQIQGFTLVMKVFYQQRNLLGPCDKLF